MRIHNQIQKFFKLFKPSFELVLLILFFLTLPLKNSYNSISILLLLFFAISRYRNLCLKSFQYHFILIAYFLYATFSFYFSSHSGLNTLLGHSILLVFPFIFSVLKFEFEILQKALNVFIYWIVALAFYSEIITIWNLLSSDQSLSLWFRKDFSYINLGSIIGIHPPYMSLFTSYSILLLIDKIGLDKRRNRLFVVLILFLLFYTIHLSSRLPILALLTLSVLFVYNKLSVHFSLRKVIVRLAPLVIIIFALFLSVRSTRHRFTELFGMKYSSGLYIKSGPDKLAQWSAAIDANTNFLFGNGLGDVKESIVESNRKHGLIKNANRRYNAHNQYIQTYVGLGIIGLVLLIGMFVYSWDSKRAFLKVHNYLLLYLSIVFLSESYFQRHQGIVFFAFVCCIIYMQKALHKTQLANKSL